MPFLLLFRVNASCWRNGTAPMRHSGDARGVPSGVERREYDVPRTRDRTLAPGNTRPCVTCDGCVACPVKKVRWCPGGSTGRMGRTAVCWGTPDGHRLPKAAVACAAAMGRTTRGPLGRPPTLLTNAASRHALGGGYSGAPYCGGTAAWTRTLWRGDSAGSGYPAEWGLGAPTAPWRGSPAPHSPSCAPAWPRDSLQLP